MRNRSHDNSPRTGVRPGAAGCFMMKRRKFGSGYQYRGNAMALQMTLTAQKRIAGTMDCLNTLLMS